MTKFARDTLTVTFLTVVGILLSFLSNLAIAARFGVGRDMDVYLAATTLPNLLNAVLTASLGAVFLPVFLESRNQGAGKEWILASTVLNLVAVASGGVALAAIAFALPLQRLLTPGLPVDQIAAAASLMRGLLPGVILVSVNQVISGVFFSRDRFFVPMAIRLFGPAVTLAFILLFRSHFTIARMVVASLTATILQTVVLAVASPKPNRLRILFAVRDPAVLRTLRLMTPMVLITCCLKVTPVFERWIASGMPSGSISTLGYATRLINILQPVVVSGISVTGFALMSGFVASRDLAGLRDAIRRNCAALLFASIPLAFFLCAFGRPLIALALERGHFTPANTLETYRLLAIYSLALPATTVGTVLGQGFYTFQDTRTPTVIGILEVFLYAGLCRLLLPSLGLMALPVAYCLYFYLSAATLGMLLSRKSGFPILPGFLKPAATATAASGLAVVAGLCLRLAVPDSNLWAAFCCALSGVAYLFLQRILFRSEEAKRLLRLAPDAWFHVGRRLSGR